MSYDFVGYPDQFFFFLPIIYALSRVSIGWSASQLSYHGLLTSFRE